MKSDESSRRTSSSSARPSLATRMKMDRSDRRGFALIMVIGVVAVLAMMVAAFATTTRIERAASANFIDGERARLIAWSGVERAKYELRRAASTPFYPLPWLAYHPADTDGPPPPLDEATAPSFRVPLDPVPAALAGDVPAAPWPSGFMGSSYYQDAANPAFLGDYYTLAVQDCNAKLHLNDRAAGLRRMLDTLARAVGLTTTDVGRRILAGRPPEGYRSVDDLRRVLTREEVDLLAPHVTCHAFVDRRVIEMGGQIVDGDTGQSSMTVRAPTLRQQPRAPINVNMASFEVLVAVFEGIGWAGPPGAPTEAVTYDQAITLAQRVIDARAAKLAEVGFGLQKWAELAQLLQGDPTNAQPGDLSPTLTSAVIANCNPNTDVNDLVPDLAVWRPVDKTDLTRATTELTFAPGGLFEVESLGVILAPDEDPTRGAVRVVAQAHVRCTVRIFERYVDTTQADFEAERHIVDAEKPSGRPNLRDLTTLPEFRNTGTARNDLLAATWDGQLVFNVITEQNVSTKGAFHGFIGDDINGRSLLRDSTLIPMPGGTTARGRAGASVVAGSLDAPDWDDGSDLMPAGARLGKRRLEWQQRDVIGTTSHHVNEAKIEMTNGHEVVETLATIPEWDYEAVDQQTFELWFKPGFPPQPPPGTTTTGAGRRHTLFYWKSGAPQAPGGSDPSTGGGQGDYGELAASSHEANRQHYLDAANAGGPGPAGAPSPHPMEPISAPPLDYFFGSPPGTGPLPWNPGPGYSEAQKEADAELYADMCDAWFEREIQEYADSIFDDRPQTGDADVGITWGAQATLEVWLESTGPDPLGVPEYRVCASFKVAQKYEDYNSSSREYARVWQRSQLVRAGTWHHVMFSLYALEPKEDAPPEHTNLYVDGTRVEEVEGSDEWPTEVHAQARRVKRVVDRVRRPGVELDFNVEDPKYRVPVQLPRGDDPVMVGERPSHDRPYSGLVDNVVFQGGWARRGHEPGPEGSPSVGRFDLWRPSLGRMVRTRQDEEEDGLPADDPHLSFRKRTPALEWDQPIRIVSYAWTSWRHENTLSGQLALGLI